MSIKYFIKNLLKRSLSLYRETFYGQKRIARKSEVYLQKLIRKNTDSITVLMGVGIGDALFCAAYLDQIPITPPREIKLIAPKRLALILTSYPFVKRFKFLSTTSREMLYLNYVIHDPVLKIRAVENHIYTSLPVLDKPRNMLLNFKEFVFLIPGDAKINFHNVTAAEKVTAIADFDSFYDKIVVLNPYSNSISLKMGQEELACFERLCRCLLQKGYIVYTNVIKDQKAIKGSKELRCSLPELLLISSKIPFIVSVRSGILDFIVKTNINMFVLYDGEVGRKVYTLEQWKCSGFLKEFDFRYIQDDLDCTELNRFITKVEQMPMRKTP